MTSNKNFEKAQYIRKELGKFLKAARLKAGVTAEEMYSQFGVDVSWIENDHISIGLFNLKTLVRIYGVPDDVLSHFLVELAVLTHRFDSVPQL